MAIVIDNFITNPNETRAFALSLPFTVYGNYPGKRTLGYANRDWIPYLERYLPSNERITWFETHPFSYNGAFQLCTKDDGNSWIHYDSTDWAAILFLTPNAPIDSGVTLYRHKKTGALGIHCQGGTDANEDAINPAEWEIDCTIGNVFNRLVMFRGSRFHKASVYFGNTSEKGRLFQTFFFNTTLPPIVRWQLTLPRVAVVIMTTNRYTYLEETLQTMRQYVHFDGCQLEDIILIDDYPARRDTSTVGSLAKKYSITKLLCHKENEGLPASWKHAWDIIRKNNKYEWIFHLEDDVKFLHDIRVRDMIQTYVDSPVPITQLALKRQPCYRPAIDIMTHIRDGTHGTAYDTFVTQTRYFMTMASLYPRDIVIRYPENALYQEHAVAHFFSPKLVGAILGTRTSPPHIFHIGTISRGNKGPGFDHLPSETDYDFISGTPVVEDAGLHQSLP